MPVPQRVNFLGWASCQLVKSLLKMVQYIRLTSHLELFSKIPKKPITGTPNLSFQVSPGPETKMMTRSAGGSDFNGIFNPLIEASSLSLDYSENGEFTAKKIFFLLYFLFAVAVSKVSVKRS
jgi:hypothetical protein